MAIVTQHQHPYCTYRVRENMEVLVRYAHYGLQPEASGTFIPRHDGRAQLLKMLVSAFLDIDPANGWMH